MYELAKQKTRGYYVIVGIIVFAFLSMLLKMAFYERPRTLNDDLISAANEINKHAPIIIDSTTRFDYVYALSGNIFQYNYTIMTMNWNEVDTIRLKSVGKELMLQQMKENPKTSFFRDNNIEIQLRYTDKNAKYIASISISPNEY